jgi:hypothetical protein
MRLHFKSHPPQQRALEALRIQYSLPFSLLSPTHTCAHQYSCLLGALFGCAEPLLKVLY